MAINRPDKVDRLILADSGGLTKEVSLFYRLCTLPIIGDIIVRPTVKTSLKQGMKRAFYNPELITEQMVDKNYERIKRPETKRTMLSVIRSNANLRGPQPEAVLTDRLHLVKASTLFIHGEQDPFISIADVQHACDLIPNASLRVIPESGHCPFIEKATEFNEAVITFLQSNS
jgi:pimeloyl-ACP methyl ester carboxylesterase